MSTERLIDELWGDEPPRTARKSLQVHVSRLRRELGEGVLVTLPQGYTLRLGRPDVDLFAFEDLVADGRARLAADDPQEAARLLRQALRLWRGPALAGLEGEPFAGGVRARLDELRLSATESRIDADLDLGRDAELIGELERLIAAHPYREGLRRQLMLALYRSGRQAEALAVYRTMRQLLHDELGVEPGPALRELEAAMLRQDPALDPSTRTRRARGARRRYPRVGAAAFGLAVAAAVAGIALDRAGDGAESSSPPLPVANSVVRIDPRTNEIGQVTRVGREPAEVAVGAGATWVVNFLDRTVSRVDASGAVETIGGVPRADHLAIDGDAVWVSSFDQGSVARIDTDTREVAASIGVPTKHAEGLAVGGGYLWITNPADARATGVETVARVDLSSGNVVSRIPVGKTPIFATFGFGSVWVSNYDDDTVSVVRPGSRTAETIPVDDGPLGIATGFGSVWVVCFWTQDLVRIDARTRHVVARIRLGRSPLDVGAGAGGIWVTNRESGTVQRIDPRTNTTVATIQLPERLAPQSVAARNGSVWVTVQRCKRTHCI